MKDNSSMDKARVVQRLLEHEGRVMLCLDATCQGVEVPRRFASDPGLMLVINVNMPQAIEIGPVAIESELRFGGMPHYCIIPYTALWSAFNPDSGHGVLWQDSIPPIIRQQHGAYPTGPLKPLPDDDQWPLLGKPQKPITGQPDPRSGVPAFKVIEGNSEAPPPEPGPGRSRPKLRVVK
ncbi:MAG: hypothetical protein HQL84_13760 [Magnetococcales bacterium]|nr:hypothetical protein [Magnetococcales bacterium]MBF0151101.1 hypothetical protein [Magnetococcales bacterium]MBF0174017.1 hypothetical protein [Magnetococcales bacterium]MBF0346764.1 hypothetical protein [Magnetococcales bacterium]MBF0630989.1 hypothetical protein [Magnetococcales bacterium]